MPFSSLGLSEPIVRAVSERGYTQPTPIQRQAIPAVLSGGDLLAGAQTGTGKTAGFTLPILERLATSRTGKSGRIRALVLTPTRELAAQVEESVAQYGKYVGLHSMSMYGGVGIHPQIARLKKPVDILVATPGRLLDHAQQKTVDLSCVEILVLDEADRMLDMGFIHDIRRVLSLLPRQRQNLLFSATFSDEIRKLADGLLDRPALIEVARRNAPAESVEQKVMLVDQRAKAGLLAHLVKEHGWFQVLVFTRTKHRANWLAQRLEKEGIGALAIHGNKSQGARTRALSQFKAGTLQVLCATDIAARGLDIVELPHVVNFEMPNVPEDYVHRIGRTGRAGATGEAISFVSPEELPLLADIEKLIKRRLPRESADGFAAGEEPPAERERPVVSRPSPRPATAGSAAGAHTRSAGAGSARGQAKAGSSPAAGKQPATTPRPKRRNAGAANGPVRTGSNGSAVPPRKPKADGNRADPRRGRAGRSEQDARQGKPSGVARREEPRRVKAAAEPVAAQPRAEQPPKAGLKDALARGFKALRRLAG